MSQKRNRSAAHATRRMAMCAILCALSVVALGIGTLLEIMDLSAACAASVVVLLILLTYGPRYALLSYAVTGVLGIILMPQSLAVWTYVGLMGYYPIIRGRLERLPRVLAWVIKLLLFAAVMAACLLIVHFLLLGGEGSLMDSLCALTGEADSRALMVWAVLGLSLFTFVIFDILLGRLILLYRFRWQSRVEKWMKP